MVDVSNLQIDSPESIVDIEVKELQYHAFCIADHIDIKAYRLSNREGLLFSTSGELYYQLDDSKYLYLFNYGAVVMLNLNVEERSNELNKIKNYVRNSWIHHHEDVLEVHLSRKEVLKSTFDVLTINRFDHEVNKIIMLNLAQSVTLDYYNRETQLLLGEIKSHTDKMQQKGIIQLNQKNALKFIGKGLNTKNSIAENLYIIDTPYTAWEDEYIDRLHKSLTVHFELGQRYRSIENTLRIIDDNLSVFMSYNHHRESSRLEWIIIILIIIEVVDTLLGKFW